MSSTSLQHVSVLCPACGYDLRGSDSGRCPECGLEIDRTALQTSAIPWAHRKSIGRFRAYWKTVWQITLGSRKLAHEAAKPQDPRDGAAFVRVTASILALALLGIFAVAIWMAEGPDEFIVERPSRFSARLDWPEWCYDLAIPWSAGAAILPVLPFSLILLAFHLAGVQRTVFRTPRDVPPPLDQVAVAIGSYSTAPMVLMVPVSMCFACLAWLTRDEDFEYEFTTIKLALGLLVVLLAVLALLFTGWRVAQWVMRTRHAGIGRAAAALLELFALWIAGAIVLLGILPWCIGFLWIAIDSFR